MWLLALEACLAMFILVFIVWWTMFHGRTPEPPPAEDKDPKEQQNKELNKNSESSDQPKA